MGSLPRITVVNGSLGGRSGNTGLIVNLLERALSGHALVNSMHLVEVQDMGECRSILEESNGFVFTTGTYWDSWGSPLQNFLEESTGWEGTQTWLGKPAAVLVTMHSVGGKEVLSRLQGVLSTLGCTIPPMSGMAYSMSNHLALAGSPSDFHRDLWCLEDLEVIAGNLMEAIRGDQDLRRGGKMGWKTWPVDEGDPRRVWVK